MLEFLMTADGEVLVAILSLALSCGLAVFYVRDRRHVKFSIENEYATNMTAWHFEAVGLLVRARLLKRDRTSLEHLTDMAQLYTLIEQGRFYFPNIDKKDGFGTDKPPAYRGYRNLALDFLVASYNLLHETPSEEGRRKLELLQRNFTSVVFELVRPRSRLDKIRALTDRYFSTDKCFEDFLKEQDGSVIEHIWQPPPRAP